MEETLKDTLAVKLDATEEGGIMQVRLSKEDYLKYKKFFEEKEGMISLKFCFGDIYDYE